eukprot:3066454-Rhodomonas_salina.2
MRGPGPRGVQYRCRGATAVSAMRLRVPRAMRLRVSRDMRLSVCVCLRVSMRLHRVSYLSGGRGGRERERDQERDADTWCVLMLARDADGGRKGGRERARETEKQISTLARAVLNAGT